MPDSFETALDFLHTSLHEMHARGIQLHARVEALDQLLEASAQSSLHVEETQELVEELQGETLTMTSVSRVDTLVAPPVRVPVEVAPPAPVAPAVQVSDDPRSKAERLAELRGPVLACTRCPNLVASRTQVVFGVGNPEAELMFVGEAPGEDEDMEGEPFVGKAGQLLTRIIETMGLSRDTVYIANILKCRPDMPSGASGNRKPTGSEMKTCLPYLEQQISIVQPRVLVALGATAMEGLLGETAPMARLRGRWHQFRGIPLMATYHPAYLLRNQSLGEKRKVWEDMLLVLEKLTLPISEKQRSYFLPKS
ncbi:uracil-DNA glycosylase [Verrucomicrobiota bacterium sgz303538]